MKNLFKESLLIFQNRQPESASENVDKPKNSFELKIDKGGEVIMKKWGMEIKDDSIYHNGELLSKFLDTKSLVVTTEGNKLVIKETATTLNGMTLEYKGESFEELYDHMAFVGINYAIQSGYCEQNGIMPACQSELMKLKLKHPNW